MTSPVIQSNSESYQLDPLSEHPNFETRFPYHLHKDAEEIKNNVQTYLVERWPFVPGKHMERFKAMAIEDWSTMISYDAPKARVEIFALMMSLMTLYDDMVERMSTNDSERTVSRVYGILLGTNVPKELDVFEKIIHDVTRKTREAHSNVAGIEATTERYLAEIALWVRIVGSKKTRKAIVEHFSIDKYLDYRCEDIGAMMGMIGQLCNREIVIPDHLYSDEDVLALLKIFCRQQATVNDMFSYRKERRVQAKLDTSSNPSEKDGHIWCNAISLFMDCNQMSPSEAMAEIKRLTTEYEDHFVEVLDKLRVKYSHSAEDLRGVDGLAFAMMDFMGATTYWYSYSARYNAGFSHKA